MGNDSRIYVCGLSTWYSASRHSNQHGSEGSSGTRGGEGHLVCAECSVYEKRTQE